MNATHERYRLIRCRLTDGLTRAAEFSAACPESLRTGAARAALRLLDQFAAGAIGRGRPLQSRIGYADGRTYGNRSRSGECPRRWELQVRAADGPEHGWFRPARAVAGGDAVVYPQAWLPLDGGRHLSFDAWCSLWEAVSLSRRHDLALARWAGDAAHPERTAS